MGFYRDFCIFLCFLFVFLLNHVSRAKFQIQNYKNRFKSIKRFVVGVNIYYFIYKRKRL